MKNKNIQYVSVNDLEPGIGFLENNKDLMEDYKNKVEEDPYSFSFNLLSILLNSYLMEVEELNKIINSNSENKEKEYYSYFENKILPYLEYISLLLNSYEKGIKGKNNLNFSNEMLDLIKMLFIDINGNYLKSLILQFKNIIKVTNSIIEKNGDKGKAMMKKILTLKIKDISNKLNSLNNIVNVLLNKFHNNNLITKATNDNKLSKINKRKLKAHGIWINKDNNEIIRFSLGKMGIHLTYINTSQKIIKVFNLTSKENGYHIWENGSFCAGNYYNLTKNIIKEHGAYMFFKILTSVLSNYDDGSHHLAPMNFYKNWEDTIYKNILEMQKAAKYYEKLRNYFKLIKNGHIEVTEEELKELEIKGKELLQIIADNLESLKNNDYKEIKEIYKKKSALAKRIIGEVASSEGMNFINNIIEDGFKLISGNIDKKLAIGIVKEDLEF